MSPTFVLFVHEPSIDSHRAVQVRGVPFTVGSSYDASVRLHAAGIPPVRIEEDDGALHAVDCGGRSLSIGGNAVDRIALRQGTSFRVGDSDLRIFAGTAESLRELARRSDTGEPAARAEVLRVDPDAAARAKLHLQRLDDLQRRLAELVPSALARAS